MSVIVNDGGFGSEHWRGGFSPLPEPGAGLDLASDAVLDDVFSRLETLKMIRVDFPDFADGRGFGIARQLRRAGYRGRLRARGHVIADQYAMARRVGFDEVEISDELAHRQPEAQWLARADWRAFDYQARLRGEPANQD